jgi:hypothetical protein
MHRFEVYQIQSVDDHADAEAEDLAAQYGDNCISCDEPVGLIAGEIFGYVVVVDENDDFWYTCNACATPVIDH